MTDLKQNTNSETNNTGNTNPEIVENNNLNLWETSETTEKNLNFSEIFSENPPDNNVETDKNIVFNNPDTNTNWETLENFEQSSTQEVPELSTPEAPNNLVSENLSSTQEPETPNNEIILWKFDNPMINTTEEPQIPQTLDQTLLEHPAILENSWNEEINTEEQQKAKLAQKEKLLQLIKAHESKAQKNWFTKWILSWVVLTACILVATCFFAKDQVINLINSLWWNQTQLSASIIDLNEDIENPEIDENSGEDIENPEIDENSGEDIENPEIDENNKSYNITHVNSEEEANYVLPAHCSDLTCYGEDKEFAPCKSFRLSENLNDNANRIGRNWICKYKDSSELVFVEFLNEENEKNLDNSTIEEKRARDVSRKTALSQLQTAIVTSQWDKWVRPGMDKGANEWITIDVIEKEIKEAWMNSIPMDPIIYNINYWLWNNYINDSAMGEYLYLVAKRNWTQNGWFLLMAKTEVEWWSNWIVCKDWTWLNKWYIDNETDIAKIRLCTNITQWNSCGISDEICTYTSEDELRYIVLY